MFNFFLSSWACEIFIIKKISLALCENLILLHVNKK